MPLRPRTAPSAVVEATPGRAPARAPDDAVAEVAGPPFTPTEAAAAIALGLIALLMSGLVGLLLAALAEEGRLSAAGIGQTAMLEALTTGLATGAAAWRSGPSGCAQSRWSPPSCSSCWTWRPCVPAGQA
jgi:hypothetical protein